MGGIDHTIFQKAGFFTCANRARICWIGIGDDARCSLCQQAVDKTPNEPGTVTAIEHVSFTNELINPARAPRLRSQATVPAYGVVTLQIAEWPSVARYDELIHGRLIEIALDEIELLVGLAPPSHHVGLAEPVPNQRQVIGGHGTKLIHAIDVRRSSTSRW